VAEETRWAAMRFGRIWERRGKRRLGWSRDDSSRDPGEAVACF
jgi:hypothetical protein